MNIDIGIANPTKGVAEPKKNIKTVITRRTPKTMLFAKSLTRFLVAFDWSLEISTSMVEGKSFAWTSLTMARIFSTVLIKFFPLRFLMSSTMAFFHLNAQEFFSFS